MLWAEIPFFLEIFFKNKPTQCRPLPPFLRSITLEWRRPGPPPGEQCWSYKMIVGFVLPWRPELDPNEISSLEIVLRTVDKVEVVVPERGQIAGMEDRC